MSRDWTPEELQAASEAMKQAGHMSYEEFCTELERQTEPRAEQEPNKAPLGLWRELQPPSPVRGR